MNIDDIVDHIICGLDLREQVGMTSLQESEFDVVEKLIAHYMAIKLKEDNCEDDADEMASHEAHETMEIVKRVWERLRETHKLRVVK